MSTNPGFLHDTKNYTTQNLIILSGVTVGSIIVLIAVAYLCERPCRRRYQDITAVRPTPNQHNLSYGLSPSTIANLPTFGYTRHGDDGSGAGGWLQCVVCLSIFQEGEEVRQMPSCKHLFHQECIDMWFYSHTTCPLCRSKVEAVGEVKVRGSGNSTSPVPPV